MGVGGVHLNGASEVVLRNVDVGPSLARTFSAELSHAVFLDHLMNTLLQDNILLREARRNTLLTLRGTETLVDEVLLNLHEELEQFLTNSTGELVDIFGSGADLPDGSAAYGVVVHKRGPAVHEFGACGAFETFTGKEHSKGVLLEDVTIHDLVARPEQWTRTWLDGQQVMGPAGDVFHLTQGLADDGLSYKGNLLMDAQLAVGALKHDVTSMSISPEEVSYYFGGIHVPGTVLEWAAGTRSDFVANLANDNAFECFGDAMSHVNKGVVGLRLAHVDQAQLVRVRISRLSNEGKDDADPKFCKSVEVRYGGKDVFGAVLENSKDVVSEGLQVDTETFSSTNGGLVEGLYYVETRRLIQNGGLPEPSLKTGLGNADNNPTIILI